MSKPTKRQTAIAEYAQALSHPTRIAILELLANHACCYHGDLSETLDVPASTLSQHLAVLKEAGLIKGETNPPKTKYCIHPKNWGLANGLFMAFFDKDLSENNHC